MLQQPIFRQDRIYLFLLFLLWGFIELIIWPSGNFPIGDAWFYSDSVEHLLDTGQIYIPEISAVPYFFLLFWGAAFCLPFGFSFTMLRLSIAVMAWIASAATFKLGREIGFSRRKALLLSLVFALHPLVVANANRFISDIPFVAFFIIAIWFFLRGMRSGRMVDWIISVLAICVTLGLRQLGLALPMAFIAVGVLNRPRREWTRLLLFLLPIPFYWLYLQWAHSMMPGASAMPGMERILDNLWPVGDALYRIYPRTGWLLMYAGLPLLTFAIPALIHSWKTASQRTKIYSLLLAFPFVMTMIRAFMDFPVGSTVTGHGIGPMFFRDNSILNIHSFAEGPNWFWNPVRLLALLGGTASLTTVFLALLKKAREGDAPRNVLHTFIFVVLFYVPVFILFGVFSDRYLIPLLVPIAAGLLLFFPSGYKMKISWLVSSMLIIGGMAAYSLASTRDLMSFNRVRWAEIRQLEEKGIQISEIDGGMEALCMTFRHIPMHENPPYLDYFGNFNMGIADREFTFVFGLAPFGQYEEYKRCELPTLSPFSPDYFLILKSKDIPLEP